MYHEKSPALAAILGVLFGGFGLMYVSVAQGLTALGVMFVLAWASGGLLTPVIWAGCGVWGYLAAEKYNRDQRWYLESSLGYTPQPLALPPGEEAMSYDIAEGIDGSLGPAPELVARPRRRPNYASGSHPDGYDGYRYDGYGHDGYDRDGYGHDGYSAPPAYSSAQSPRFCGSCGSPVHPENRFCTCCGTPTG